MPALLASVLALSACNKPGSDEAGDDAADGGPGAGAKPAPVELDSAGYNAQRTQAFGFLSRLPAETEAAFGLRDLGMLVAAIVESDAMQHAAATAAGFGAGDADEILAGAQMVQATIETFVGSEVFVAMAGGSAHALKHLNTLSDELGGGLSALYLGNADVPQGGALGEGGDPVAQLRARLLAGLADDGSALSKSLEGLVLPPMIVGSKMAGEAANVVRQLEAVQDALPPFVLVSEFKVGGAPFTAWTVHLQDVVTEDFELQINEFLEDRAASKKVAEILRRKTIAFSFGALDSYFIATLGSDHRHLDLVAKPQESLLATSPFAFADQFLSKPLLGYGFVTKAMLESGDREGSVEDGFGSLADLLGELGAGGDEMAAAVRRLGTHLARVSGGSASTYLGLSFIDRGIRGESMGGHDTPLWDGGARSMFADLAPEDAALVLSAAATEQGRERSIELMEALFAVAEAGIEMGVGAAGDPAAGDQYQAVQEMLWPDLAKVWDVLKGDFLDGLGRQTGAIVDLAGALPKVPGLPRVLVNEGKAPRVILASDVADRAKLATAWDGLRPAIDAIMEDVSQIVGADVQFPDVIDTTGDHLTTYYIPAPLFGNDFLPSLSLNDDLFLLSTSKTFAEALAARAAAGAAGDSTTKGIYARINFALINAYASAWLDLVRNNSAEIIGEDEFALESFNAQYDNLRALLILATTLRDYRYNRFSDNGSWRSSWHLQTGDLGAE